MKRAAASKVKLRARITYWHGRFQDEAKFTRKSLERIEELKKQMAWMQLKIDRQYHTIEILGEQYRKVYKQQFAEDTKKIMLERERA